MKKYLVSLEIKTIQTVFYEIEAENHKKAREMVTNDDIDDIAKPIDETIPEVYSREIFQITEIKK